MMRFDNEKYTAKRTIGGIVIGLINGTFGGGGGMVAVPLLKNSLDLPSKKAHATAILIIAPVCAVSAISYVLKGYAVPSVLIPASIGNILGGIVGAKLLNAISNVWVEITFIALMLLVGVKMFF